MVVSPIFVEERVRKRLTVSPIIGEEDGDAVLHGPRDDGVRRGLRVHTGIGLRFEQSLQRRLDDDGGVVEH